MSTMSRTKRSTTFTLGDNLDESYTGSSLRKGQGLEPNLHPLNTAKVVYKLENSFFFEMYNYCSWPARLAPTWRHDMTVADSRLAASLYSVGCRAIQGYDSRP